jgi:succinate dehydrogenase/fumarate reductase flavoprotein subunit
MRCNSANDVMRAFELLNLLTTAKLVIGGALIRKESRGSQYREDFPETDDTLWQRSIRTDEYLKGPY